MHTSKVVQVTCGTVSIAACTYINLAQNIHTVGVIAYIHVHIYPPPPHTVGVFAYIHIHIYPPPPYTLIFTNSHSQVGGEGVTAVKGPHLIQHALWGSFIGPCYLTPLTPCLLSLLSVLLLPDKNTRGQATHALHQHITLCHEHNMWGVHRFQLISISLKHAGHAQHHQKRIGRLMKGRI